MNREKEHEGHRQSGAFAVHFALRSSGESALRNELAEEE